MCLHPYVLQPPLNLPPQRRHSEASAELAAAAFYKDTKDKATTCLHTPARRTLQSVLLYVIHVFVFMVVMVSSAHGAGSTPARPVATWIHLRMSFSMQSDSCVCFINEI